MYKAKTNSKGKCPIKCRITFNKTRKEFSTGLFIKPEHWNSKTQFVEPPEPDEPAAPDEPDERVATEESHEPDEPDDLA